MILWCAFGVIVAADHLAEMLGEPYGTLILTFSIVAIEVMLISTVMLGGGAETVGRDTMFAVMMIVLNGVVGLSLSSAASSTTRRSTASRARARTCR